MKFSFGLAKEHQLGQGIQRFADLVAQKTGGKIKITLYSNTSLGGYNQNSLDSAEAPRNYTFSERGRRDRRAWAAR